MLQLAPGVSQLAGFPRNHINVYRVENILVGAGTVAARRRILRQVKGLDLVANLITHAHPDHFGSSHALCTRFGIPLGAGARSHRNRDSRIALWRESDGVLLCGAR